MDRPIHPACALWPRPSDEEVLAIAADIKVNGLLNPIWLFEGAILDGKTRYEACGIASVEPRFETYIGDDPIGFVVTQNAKRRHMSQGAIGLVVAELATLKRGGDRGNQYTGGKVFASTLADLADAAQLGRATVANAKAVLDHGESNIIEMVRKDEVGVHSAAAFVNKTPRSEQRKASPEHVKKEGYALRDRNASLNKLKKRNERMITIPYLDVINELLPLIRRIKEQSKRHPGTVSLTELSMVAQLLDRLADKWVKNGEEPETHSNSVPSTSVRG